MEAGRFQGGRTAGPPDPVVAGYRIEEELGGRGGAQVFKAISLDHSSPVAIKIFPASTTGNKETMQQLLQSLRTVARIDQSGIPGLIGSGTVAGRPYIVMPFFASGSLADRLEMGMLSLPDLGQTLGEITSVLGCAHSHGVVHGDLKPSEILFDMDGQMQVIGLGQTFHPPVDSGSSPQPADEIYKAPEVVAGQPPTPASDQFSLALIALEIATGLDPSNALRSIMAGQADGPQYATRQDRSRPSLPARVTLVLQRALADVPAQRFPSVADMERALLAALHNTPLPEAAPTAGTPARVSPRRKRSALLALLAATFAVALCFVTTIPAMSSSNLRGFNLSHYTSLLVDALSAENGQAPASFDSPISTLDKTDPVSSGASTAINGELSTSSAAEAGMTPTHTPSSPGDLADGPTDAPQPADLEAPTDPMSVPTSTWSSPVSTPTPFPSSTPAPTSVPSATPVTVQATDIPPTDPGQEPTINPNKCKSDPGHKNYCTPVP